MRSNATSGQDGCTVMINGQWFTQSGPVTSENSRQGTVQVGLSSEEAITQPFLLQAWLTVRLPVPVITAAAVTAHLLTICYVPLSINCFISLPLFDPPQKPTEKCIMIISQKG